MFRLRLLLNLSLAFGLAACAAATIDLTDLQKQELQTRTFEAEKEIVFASTVSVLQDVGYVFEQVDKDTGIITGESPVKDTTNKAANFFKGLFTGNKENSSSSATKVSAFMEQIGKNTRIRITFLEKSSKKVADKPIYDTAVYQSVFQKIEDGIFLRQGTR